MISITIILGDLNLNFKFLKNIKTTISDLRTHNTLYYPGCMTRYCLINFFNNYKELLSDMGIDYITLKDLNCCGSPLLNAGYASDFEELKQKNLKILKTHNITKIITNCPHCYDLFKNHYNIPVEHITQTLARNKHKLITENDDEAAYHDPCILARKNNLTKEPREVLKRTGFKLIEPFRNKENTFCCGAGGGVKQNSPKIANKIAEKRLNQLNSKKIIVSCPYCYAHLKENTDNKKKIIELSETLLE